MPKSKSQLLAKIWNLTRRQRRALAHAAHNFESQEIWKVQNCHDKSGGISQTHSNTTCTPTPISTNQHQSATPASHSSTIAASELHLRHRLEAVWVARSNTQGSHSKSFECTAPHMPILAWRCGKGKAMLKSKCWNYLWNISWRQLKG